MSGEVAVESRAWYGMITAQRACSSNCVRFFQSSALSMLRRTS